MNAQYFLSILFGILVVGFLIVDLGFFNRKAHKIPAKSALLQSLFWIAMAVIFGALIFFFIDRQTAAAFMTAYVTEKLLSVDNLFVILLIFNFFNLDEEYHHRVLFWGILGAIVFRAVFIGLGAVIIEHFHWVLYIFGAILVYTGIKLFVTKKEEHVDYNQSRVLRLARKFLPFTTAPHHGRFFITENGKLHATILFMIILLVESTDIIFAVDSIPAAFAITQNTFVIFTSNIFAIMGLRALFFLIENIAHRFHHLQKGLSFILVFIGGKMLLDIIGVHLSSVVSFSVIMTVFAASIGLSYAFPKKI